MISRLEQEIILALLHNLDKRLSIRQIAGILEKSYPNIYNKTTELIELNLLKKEKIGKSIVCRLNIQNDILRNVLAHIDLLKREKTLKKNTLLSKILLAIKLLPPHIPVLTAFSFGSYIGMCLDRPGYKDEILGLLSKSLDYKEMSGIVLFEKNELARFILPEIISKKIILHNPEIYYKLISEVKSESLFD